MSSAMSRPPDLPELSALSATIGADPLIIQAAGGNTSIKQDDVMWIKASGTQLAQANERDIFVPVDLVNLREKVLENDPLADQPGTFLLGEAKLRPSIETSLHAVFEQRVVVHVHCVQTIAHAIRVDREELLRKKLQDFSWALAPYRKPGANLANEVRKQLGPETDVVVLSNHGLIVAAETVDDARSLLNAVTIALNVPPSAISTPDVDSLESHAPPFYQSPPASHPLHQLAFGTRRIEQATGGSLYPDHVLFCGIGAQAVTLDRLSTLEDQDAPVFVIVPGHGALIRKDATDAAWALSRCLADVLMRVPPTAQLTYLSEPQNLELLDWDAEKYRLKLNANS